MGEGQGKREHRNDITIGVTYDGEMWVAQGSAQPMMLDPNGELYAKLSDVEEELNFSKLKHRTIAKVEGEEGYVIARPRDLRGRTFGPTFYSPDIRGGRLLMVGRAYEAVLFGDDRGEGGE